MKYPDETIWWLTFASLANTAAVLFVLGMSIWGAIDTDRKFRAVDARMWNMENAQ